MDQNSVSNQAGDSDQSKEEAIFLNAMLAARQELRDTMLEKLKDHDWLERMRLRCRRYIENNGTKTISLEEVREFLSTEALKSFPQNVFQEMEDEVKGSIFNFN